MAEGKKGLFWPTGRRAYEKPETILYLELTLIFSGFFPLLMTISMKRSKKP